MKTTKEMIEVMEWFEGGGAIECANNGDTDWEVVTKPLWNWNNFEYRIKEFQYPMWFKDDSTWLIIKFDGLKSGTVVEEGTTTYKKGEYRANFIPHTDANIWTEIEEPKEKVRIEKWLVCSNEGDYRVIDTSNIHMIKNIVSIKLLDTYDIEI